MAESYTYDSFGNTTNSSVNVTNPFRFTGRDFDSETGLYYYRARYYAPPTGRFVSEDPIRFWGGINFYPYVADSPVDFRDPSGQFPTWWHRDQTYKLARNVFGPKCEDKARTVADADAAGRTGMGVHAGRANRGGPNAKTKGCVRTTNACMQDISNFVGTDPLQSITIAP